LKKTILRPNEKKRVRGPVQRQTGKEDNTKVSVEREGHSKIRSGE